MGNGTMKVINITNKLVTVKDVIFMDWLHYCPTLKMKVMSEKSIEIEGTEIVTSISEVIGVSRLPPKQKDTIYIVPMEVALVTSNRTDLYTPRNLVRDISGEVLYATELTRPVLPERKRK